MKHPLRSSIALAAWVFASTVSASADVVTVRKEITLDGAQRVIAAALAAEKAAGSHGAVAVVDAGGNVIAVASADGTFPQAAEVAIGKAHTAAVFRKDTSFFENSINSGRTTLVAMRNFTPLQGGVLIRVGGEVVGAVGVSGTASQQQDEEVAKAGAAALGAQ
ncbi:MAG TPA: heme-binding protein [Candidatus Baltobacteraceae bacterium]|nr:heme-binding protein [Candidatus Baltobacteraceae bacterium]